MKGSNKRSKKKCKNDFFVRKFVFFWFVDSKNAMKKGPVVRRSCTSKLQAQENMLLSPEKKDHVTSECPYCHVTLKSSYKRHLKLVHRIVKPVTNPNKKKFECLWCDEFKTKSKQLLAQHERKHHPVQRKGLLSEDYVTAFKPSYVCSFKEQKQCPFRSFGKSAMTHHEQTAHRDDRSWNVWSKLHLFTTCNLCNESVRNTQYVLHNCDKTDTHN